MSPPGVPWGCSCALWLPKMGTAELLAWSRIFPEVNELFLCVPSEGCPLLEQLIISWCDQVTKDGIQALVRGCGGLRALSLKGCTQVQLWKSGNGHGWGVLLLLTAGNSGIWVILQNPHSAGDQVLVWKFFNIPQEWDRE